MAPPTTVWRTRRRFFREVLLTVSGSPALWVSAVVGRRNFRNIKGVILNTLQRGRFERRFLFTTDGFEMYEWAAKGLLLGVCRALHSDILDFGCRVAVTEQELYLSGTSAVIGDLKLPRSVAGPVRIGRPEGARGGVRARGVL